MRAMMEDKPGWYYEGTKQQVLLLASPDDSDTRLLEQPVVNTTKDAGCRTFAYTLGTRYTSSVREAAEGHGRTRRVQCLGQAGRRVRTSALMSG